MTSKPQVENFDSLPDTAPVTIEFVAALVNRHPGTVRRWVDNGTFPPPRQIGNARNLWLAGDIRQAFMRGVAK